MVDILIQGSEEAGSITSQGLLIIACHKVFHWIIQVKSKLTSPDWGNSSRNEVINLINEARLAVSFEKSKNEFDLFYENSILSSSSIPSTSTGTSGDNSDETKIEEKEMVLQATDQYVTPSKKDKRGRKKDLKVDDISEIDSKDGIEDPSLLEEGDDSSRKKRKGGRGKRIQEEEIPLIDDPKSNKKRSRVSLEENQSLNSNMKKRSRQSKGEVSLDENEHDSHIDSATTSTTPTTSTTSPLYFDPLNPHTNNLPPSVIMLIDMWIRWLILFLKRIDEIEIWKNHSYQIITNSLSSSSSSSSSTTSSRKISKKMLTRDQSNNHSSSTSSVKDWNTIILKPEDESSVIQLLDWAKQRNLSCSIRKLIERRYHNSLEWHEKVTKILTIKSCRVSLDDTQLILKESEDSSLLFLYPDLIGSLKENIKKAKLWINKLEKSIENTTSNTSNSSLLIVPITIKELEDILPETESICIDLSSQINNILQHTKVYCLCREASHGMMLGCEKCEDWCHISCFGFTKAQVNIISHTTS